MPLFFLMSAMTYRFSIKRKDFIKKTYKSFKHLVIPAFVIYGIRQGLFIVKHHNELQLGIYARSCALSLFYCSGVDIINNCQVPAFGMMWFLIVLFIGRTIFDLINMYCSKKIMALVSIMISIIGIIISSKSWLPLSLDIAMAIFPFFWIGLWLKARNEKYIKGKLTYIFFIIWIGLFFIIYVVTNDYLELAARRYPLFPLCYICALMGILFVSCLAKLLLSFEKIRVIEEVGKNSIWIFAIHAMDYLYRPIWDITNSMLLNGFLRIIEDILIYIAIRYMLERKNCKNY